MEFVILYLLVNIAAGAAACFFGKRLFYVLLGVLVFIGVFNVALGSTDASPVSLAIGYDIDVLAAIGAVLGVVAALLSKYAYKAGVFIVGLVSGAALGFIVTMLLPREAADYLGVIMVVAGVLLGLAAVRWADAAVRIGTAWAGSSFLVPTCSPPCSPSASSPRARCPETRSRPSTPSRPSWAGTSPRPMRPPSSWAPSRSPSWARSSRRARSSEREGRPPSPRRYRSEAAGCERPPLGAPAMPRGRTSIRARRVGYRMP